MDTPRHYKPYQADSCYAEPNKSQFFKSKINEFNGYNDDVQRHYSYNSNREEAKVQKVSQYQYEYSSSSDDEDQQSAMNQGVDVQSVASSHYRKNVMPPIDDEVEYKSDCQSHHASTVIDENCSVFEPGAPSELNKKLQREHRHDQQQ